MQTRYTFDGVEYGVVGRDVQGGDRVVVTKVDREEVEPVLVTVVAAEDDMLLISEQVHGTRLLYRYDKEVDVYRVVERLHHLDETRFNFNGVEYGVVDRDAQEGDFVVVTKIHGESTEPVLTEVQEVMTHYIQLIDREYGTYVVFTDTPLDTFYVVEPLESDQSRGTYWHEREEYAEAFNDEPDEIYGKQAELVDFIADINRDELFAAVTHELNPELVRTLTIAQVWDVVMATRQCIEEMAEDTE